MPVYQAQLDDGRLVSLESDHPPTEEEILGALDDYHAQRKAALTAERAKVRAEPPASVWGGKLKPDDDFSTPREIKEPPLTQVGLLDLVSQPLKEIVPKVGRETMERILNAPASLARERMEMTPDEEENSPLTKAMAQAIPSDKAVSIVTGTEHAAADLGNFFTSPLGIATLGIGLLPKLAQRAVALGFAAQMASGVPGIATELGSELGKPENERDYQKIAELTANGAAAVGFTAAGVTHGVGRPLAEKLGAYGGGPGLSGEATTAAPRPPRGPAAPPVDVTEELRKSLQESILGNQIKGKTPGVTVDVAPASGEVSPPESAEPAPPVTSFTTAKGSTYEVHEDGTTTRNKAARPEHPGEEGLQPRSSKTYYVSHTDSIYLGEIQTQGATVRRRIAQLPNGQIGIQYLDGKDAGKFESRTIADAEPGPAIGLTPVEVWDEPGGQAVHFGNEITEVRTDPRPKAEAKPAKLSQEDFVSDDPDWSIPDGALEAEHAERENELTLGPGRETTETASPGTSTVRTGTDDQGPNDERTGSAMTAESGVNPDRGEATPSLPKAPEPLPKGKKKFKAQRYDDDDNRGWDLIDEVESQLGGKISLAAARLLNSDFRPVGAARKLFGQSRWKPDIARQAVEANFPFDSDDEFLEALNATARGRIDARERWNRENRLLKQEEEQMETFNRDRKRQAGRKAQMLISDDLLEGDEFRMNGAKFRVERLGFDEHGHVTDVTLDDGKKYGTQRVREGTEILIDEGTLKRETNSEGGALREEAPLYGAPESVEEQKVRLAREAATRKKAADRDELERRRTSKLEGSRGDIGQRDLLGGGDLFSETAPAPEPGDPSLWNIPDKELLAEIDAVTERKVAGDLDRAGHERLRNLIHEYQERRPKIDRRKKTADPASDERPSQPDRDLSGREQTGDAAGRERAGGREPGPADAGAEPQARASREIQRTSSPLTPRQLEAQATAKTLARWWIKVRGEEPNSPGRSQIQSAIGSLWRDIRRDALDTIIAAARVQEAAAISPAEHALSKVRMPNGDLDIKRFTRSPAHDVAAVFRLERIRGAIRSAEAHKANLSGIIYPGVEARTLRAIQRLLEGGKEALPDAEKIAKTIEEPDPLTSEKGGEQKTFGDWLDRAIDATSLDRGKALEGVLGAPVWITKAALNGVFRVIRSAYRGGKSIAHAIEEGVDWLRDQRMRGFNSSEARNWLHSLRPEDFDHPERATPAAEPASLPGEDHKLKVGDKVSYGVTEGIIVERSVLGSGQLSLRMRITKSPNPAAVGQVVGVGSDFVRGVSLRKLSDSLPTVESAAEPASERVPRLIEELPERSRNLFKWAATARRKLAAVLAARPNKDLISYLKDKADNTAVVVGKQSANSIRHMLNRAFGEADIDKMDQVREWALTFAVEAGAGGEGAPRGQPGLFPSGRMGLEEFRNTLLSSQHRGSIWAKRALAAIRFADENWEGLQPVAEMYQKLTDAQNTAENASGFDTLYRRGGYVFHTQDVLEHWDFPDVGGGGGNGGGAPAPFRHIRDHATYADSIANGLSPKSLSAVDLLQRRMTLGQRLINYGTWVDTLGRVLDPTTETPIVTQPVVRQRGDGSSDATAPAGYELSNFGGQRVAVHRGYSGLFADLTDPSWMRKTALREGLMKVAGTAKHTVLLFDTFHLGRLAFWNATARVGLPRYSRGLTLLDNTVADIQEMVHRGEVPAEWGPSLLDAKRKLGLLLDGGLNVGNVGDNLYTDWVQKLPVSGRFNKWLFERYQRGAMSEVGMIEFERQQKMHPELSDAAVARLVARDVNTRFGNLNSQSWIKSKTGQDLARLLFLAPQWNESLIRAEMGAVKQTGQAVVGLSRGRLQMGMLGRSVGTAVLGTFVANQIINYATRGKPTWENEEEEPGAKISAYIPDHVGGGPGFFLNPLAVPAEITHLLWKGTNRSGDFGEALRQFAVGRLNNLTKPIYTFFSGKDVLGRSLRPGAERYKAMAAEALPLPISGSALYRGGKQLVTGQHEEAFPGQYQKQAMQTFGVKTDPAPDAGQRISRLAREFNRQDPGFKPNPEYYGGDYSDLRKSLTMGNRREALAALEDLRAKKTEEAIGRYMRAAVNHPFTGSKKKEAVFLETLNPEQRGVYDRAVQDRQNVLDRFEKLVDEAPVSVAP